MKKNTRCVHSGSYIDPVTRGLNTPVYTSSSFEYVDMPDNMYPRYFNTPNQKAVAAKLCALEGADAGLIFSSGMAAISAVLLTYLHKGDHVVLQRDIYGGTHYLATADFNRFGIEYTMVSNRIDAIAAAIRPKTRLVYIESPSNPLLMITDIAAVAELTRTHNLVSVIDNTFATPILQNPLALGIDIVVHSGTKYIGGHSDICCGAALGSKEQIAKVAKVAANLGGSLNAQTCALIERSLKTMGLRVQRQSENAARLAAFLAQHQRIAIVNYPGLTTHPDHQLAARQMSSFGAMLSFEPAPESGGAQALLERLDLITPALSLGGVETIICAPAATSHAKLSDAERRELGISPDLLRLSVGIEDVEDLVDDLQQALAA